MKIASRNVNWIRAVIQKWFFERINIHNPDIVCLQEVKAFETQIPTELRFSLSEYDILRHQWTKPWYAGTAIFYKKWINVLNKISEFPYKEFYDEGRVTELDFLYEWKNICLLNVYFPNGWNRADWTEMLSYKLDFYEKIRTYLSNLRNNKNNIIICWDFNICHKEIDIARPKENEWSIWFLPIERAELDNFEDDWLIDSFRHFNPTLKDHYTWWSYRAWARPRNIWRRLDYFWISPELVNNIKNITQQSDVLWSDHCPVLIEL